MVSKRNYRKPVEANLEAIAPIATVSPLKVEELIIVTPSRGKCHLKRLLYKDCPILHNQTAEFKFPNDLIKMDREHFVRDIYQLLSEDITNTTSTRFHSIIHYVSWLDKNGRFSISGDYYHRSLLDEYMRHWKSLIKLGKGTKARWSQVKNTLSWILKQKNRKLEAGQLPSVVGVQRDTKPFEPLDLELELKPVARELFRAYLKLQEYFKNGQKITRHPLYNKKLLDNFAKKNDLKGRKLAGQRSAFKNVINNSCHPNNHIIRVAMMLCFMFTGMNYTPLAKMKIRDVQFKEISGGKYILNAEKDRAKHVEIDNALGFSKHAKEFMSNWLEVVTKMVEGNIDAPLFPYFKNSKDIIHYSESQKSAQAEVNKLLAKLGLPTVSSSRFRKTKTDAIFKATESIYLVAMSANNSIQIVQSKYTNGLKQQHEQNLAASFDAQYSIANGSTIEEAVNAAKYKFSDVLDNYEFQRLREGSDRDNESRTPIGVRCKNNLKGASKVISKSLKKMGIKQDESEAICTNFLGCFECSEHALVAEVEDIWLMMSFYETLQQLLQITTINSTPKKEYSELTQTIDSILQRFKEKSPKNYREATELNKESAHPLYNDIFSLEDLLEVFS